MSWILGYLLVGFVIEWMATHVFGKGPRFRNWKWALLVTLTWPIGFVMGAFEELRS
jgi:hypothetical protein